MPTLMEALAHELEHEGATTRRALERIPEDRFDYKPHEKSYSTRELASHLADSLTWTEPTLTTDVMEMDMEEWKPFVASSKAELLARFDESLSAAVTALRSAADSKAGDLWTMKDKKTGQIFFSMPRAAVLRSFVLNHLIHHRGQLSIYLRLMDVPVPQIYGPTADEPQMTGPG